MKVVLFCGGLGLRLHPSTERTPKPLINVGDKPILLHLMKYYSYFGHNDFILCLGYKANLIKNYFLKQKQYISDDFILSKDKVQFLNKDTEDWRITFVNTGLHSNIAQRLKAVARYLEGEDTFLANYSDMVTDLELPKLIDFFGEHNKTACFLSVRPYQSFHVVSVNEKGLVQEIQQVNKSKIRINGGFFVFKNKIFDYIFEGEELVNEPFQRLIAKREIMAYEYNGFWGCMDTFKDKQHLDDLYYNDEAPWELWKRSKKGGKIGV